MKEMMNKFYQMHSINKLNFKDIRENCRLTIDEVAAATGLHRRTIEKVEEDCSNVYISVLVLLCECYDISPNYIQLGSRGI
ncbi:helix-turn-helix domain-containing protein [Paenibacillus popilliae]|nr:helix-turn-helix transcriptional regulator [Paenibacillus popilliae]